MRRHLKRLGASYRRARRVPARPANAHQQNIIRRALQKVRRLASLGHCDLMYGDESGFSLSPCVPYLWQPRGKTVGLPAQSHHQRQNVLGFWKEEALEEQQLIFSLHRETLKARHFVQAIEEKVLPSLRRKTVLVIDNARLHRCALVESKTAYWKAQGLHLWFLPAYCPQLNRIEILWRRVKYLWLQPQDYCDFKTLTIALRSIFQAVPTNYAISFA